MCPECVTSGRDRAGRPSSVLQNGAATFHLYPILERECQAPILHSLVHDSVLHLSVYPLTYSTECLLCAFSMDTLGSKDRHGCCPQRADSLD